MVIPRQSGALGNLPPWCGGRPTETAGRGGRFAAAYLAFEIATVGAGLVIWCVQQGSARIIDVLWGVAVLTALSAPIAWLPLAVVLYRPAKTRGRQIVVCILAGVIAGCLLAIEVEFFLDRIRQALEEPGHVDDMLSWLVKAITEFLEFLGPGALSGALGGFFFWRVYFRRERSDPCHHSQPN